MAAQPTAGLGDFNRRPSPPAQTQLNPLRGRERKGKLEQQSKSGDGGPADKLTRYGVSQHLLGGRFALVRAWTAAIKRLSWRRPAGTSFLQSVWFPEHCPSHGVACLAMCSPAAEDGLPAREQPSAAAASGFVDLTSQGSDGDGDSLTGRGGGSQASGRNGLKYAPTRTLSPGWRQIESQRDLDIAHKPASLCSASV